MWPAKIDQSQHTYQLRDTMSNGIVKNMFMYSSAFQVA